MTKLAFFRLLAFALLMASCSVNKAKIDSGLKIHFDAAQVDGCFSLLENAGSEITIYNMTLDTQRVTPGSTFRIVSSLIGLETGKITDEKMVIPWDSVQRPQQQWNKDLSMEEAFKVASSPYDQEVARRIGPDTLKRWLDTLRYGNMKMGSPIDSFWLNNSLKISPDEQLGLMYGLFFDRLPFTKRSQQIVRNLMLQENNTLYKLSYTSGSGIDETGHPVGWVVGWILENRHVYFFVTLVKSPQKNGDTGALGVRITKDILTELGFFKGEK